MRTMRVLRAMLACVMIVCLLFPGCSVPDDENWDLLKGAVTRLPPETHTNLAKRMVFEEAYMYLQDRSKQDIFIEIDCSNDGDTPITFGFSIEDVMRCMGTDPYAVFAECVNVFVRRAHGFYASVEGASDMDIRCKPHLSERYKYAPVKQWVLPDDDEIVEHLVKSESLPEWAWELLGVTVVGGMLLIGAPELLPVLCALSDPDHWSCPSSPLYPPGRTPQPEPDR